MTPLSGNRIPEKVKTVHLIGACGTAMGALACMLKEMGFGVTGSDQHVYPPMSTFLEKNGIVLKPGFSKEHLVPRPDLVVVGNAIKRSNPEAAGLREAGIPFCSMPQAVNRFLVAGKKAVVVTGTHGKTTVASLMAHVLFEAGRDPSFLIGGILNNFRSNYRVGKGDIVVLEGDEYDTAYFDKGPKFLHYDAHVAILTGIEFDHADIFPDLDHVRQAFSAFVSGLSPEALLIGCGEDAEVRKLAAVRQERVRTYGRVRGADWKIGKIQPSGMKTVFEPLRDGQSLGSWEIPLAGAHNLLNTLSVLAAADHLEIPAHRVRNALRTFEGVKRRQEIRGMKNGIVIMDDFAHHPTAVRETVAAVKGRFGSGRLIAVFEPRTNTSMRNTFQQVYPNAFNDADVICIRKPPLLEKIPEGNRFSSETLVSDLIDHGKDAHFFENTEGIIDFLAATAAFGDVVLIMSNGGFDNIHERLLDRL